MESLNDRIREIYKTIDADRKNEQEKTLEEFIEGLPERIMIAARNNETWVKIPDNVMKNIDKSKFTQRIDAFSKQNNIELKLDLEEYIGLSMNYIRWNRIT